MPTALSLSSMLWPPSVCEVDDVIAIALESGVDNGDKIDDTIR